MKVHEMLRAADTLVVGMARLNASRWPEDTYAFARAAKKLAAEGNRFASQFRPNMGTLGEYSHEFREMQAYLRAATLIGLDLTSDTFQVRISKRSANSIAHRNHLTEEEQAEALALLQAHWQEVYGEPLAPSSN